MTQSIDFATTVLCPSVSTEPSDAQFRLDETGVSIDGIELSETAGLKEIFDVRLGQPPQAAREAFSGTVLTIGFERDGHRVVVFVDGTESTLQQVSGLLFRRLLDGTEVAITHPTTIGGRVTDRQTEIGTLRITPGNIGCTGITVPCNVELDSVVGVNRSEKELLGRTEPTVELQYVEQGVVVGADLSLNPPRKLNLLGRYLRRKYSRIRRRVRHMNPPDQAIRVLTRLHAHGGTTTSGAMLERASNDPEALLRYLLTNDFVELDAGEIQLTMPGWVLVSERMGTTTAVET